MTKKKKASKLLTCSEDKVRGLPPKGGEVFIDEIADFSGGDEVDNAKKVVQLEKLVEAKVKKVDAAKTQEANKEKVIGVQDVVKGASSTASKYVRCLSGLSPAARRRLPKRSHHT